MFGHELIKQISFKPSTENSERSRFSKRSRFCKRSRCSKRSRMIVSEKRTKGGKRAFCKRMLNRKNTKVAKRERSKTRLRRDFY
mgnify:CR=1 FL=1